MARLPNASRARAYWSKNGGFPTRKKGSPEGFCQALKEPSAEFCEALKGLAQSVVHKPVFTGSYPRINGDASRGGITHKR